MEANGAAVMVQHDVEVAVAVAKDAGISGGGPQQDLGEGHLPEY
jgi:hypothetical protein